MGFTWLAKRLKCTCIIMMAASTLLVVYAYHSRGYNSMVVDFGPRESQLEYSSNDLELTTKRAGIQNKGMKPTTASGVITASGGRKMDGARSNVHDDSENSGKAEEKSSYNKSGPLWRMIQEEGRPGDVVNEIESEERIRKRLPQALVIGQKKCGTGAFKRFLQFDTHFKSVTKELHFFDQNETYGHGLEFYQNQMPKSWPKQITVEGSPRYFYTPYVPERVHAMNDSIKLLLMLCDPAKRLVSEYAHLKSFEGTAKRLARSENGDESFLEPQSIELVRQYGWYPSFNKIVFHDNATINTDYHPVTNGIYIHHLRHWLQYFPSEQIHIINATAFLQRPWLELNSAVSFLGLAANFTEDNFYYNDQKKFYCLKVDVYGCLSKAKGRKHPQIEKEQMRRIREFYEPYNKQLYDLLGEDFRW